MTCLELIKETVSRLTRIKRVNLAIILCLPLALALLAWLLQSARYVPRPFELPLYTLVALVTLLLLERSLHLFSKTTPTEAAQRIDKATEAKERFLTLASFSQSDSAESLQSSQLSLVEKQSEAFLKDFDLHQSVPFELSSSAKVSLLASPLIFGITLLLLILKPTAAFAPSEAELQRSEEHAQAIEELLENTPDLPQELREELEEFAELIREEGMYSELAFEQLEDTLAAVDEFREDLENQTLSQAEDEVPQSEPTLSESPKAEEREVEKQKQEETPENAGEQQEQTPEQQPEPQPEEKQDAEQTPPENAEQKQASEEKQAEMKKGGAEEKKSGEQNPEQKSDTGKQQDSQKEGSKQADESGKGEQEKDDPKKDTRGLGEGQGKGKSGSKKQQEGESQEGQDDSGAKQGGAKNQSSAGGEQGEEKGKTDKPGEKGKQNSGEGKKQGQENSQQKTAGSKGSKESQSLSKVENKLEDIKKEMQQKGESGDKGQGEKKQDKDGSPSKNAQAQPGQSKDEQSKKKQGTTQGAPSDSKKKSGQGDKQGKKNSGSPQEKESSAEAKKDGKNQGKSPTEGKGADGKKGSESDRGNNTPPEGLKTDPSKKPKDIAAPQQQARRYGPFGGGKDGQGSGDKAKVDSVEVPQGEEKIVVRSLGSTDNKNYKNQTGANAKTKIGSTEFRKPQSDVPESKQPIPVEYGDILR